MAHVGQCVTLGHAILPLFRLPNLPLRVLLTVAVIRVRKKFMIRLPLIQVGRLLVERASIGYVRFVATTNRVLVQRLATNS